MSKRPKTKTVRNVLIALSVCLFIFGGGIMMCFNFPQEKNKTANGEKGITVSAISNIPEHITEAPFENFIIDADVKIGIKENFNIYTAVPYSYDKETLKKYFLQDLRIVESQKDDFGTYSVDVAENGSSVSESSGKTTGFSFSTKEVYEKNLTYCGKMGNIEPLRDKLFPKKDLAFMSSNEALNIVKEAMSNFDISVSEYNIYPIDYEYIRKIDNENLKKYGADDYTANTKDDEHYLIVMDVTTLPNNGLLAEIDYDIVPVAYVESGKVHALVGKNGLLELKCNGIYSVTDEEKNEHIISFEEVLGNFKSSYQGVKFNGEFNVYKIELAYIPYMTDIDNAIYTLKPTWIFRMYEDSEKESDRNYFNKFFDATTGKEFVPD